MRLAAMFKNIGGLAFGFMLPVLAGYIAYSIAEKARFGTRVCSR